MADLETVRGAPGRLVHRAVEYLRHARGLGGQHRSWLLHDTIRRRILLVALTGMLLSVAILGALGLWGVRESINQTLQERLTLSRAIASHLDYVLSQRLETLQVVAQRDGVSETGGDSGPGQRALAAAFQSGDFSRIYLLDKSGRVVAMEPAGQDGAVPDLSTLPHVRAGLASGRQIVTNIYRRSSGTNVVSFVIPIKDQAGNLAGLVVGDSDLPDARLQQIIQPIGLGQMARVDVVDASGVVLASSNESFLFRESDHKRQMAALIEARRSTVGTCHSCHEPSKEAPEPDVMALAPMSSASWAVVVREAEREALAPSVQLQWRILAVAVPLFLVAAICAVLIGRGLARSVDRLAKAAEGITSGDLVTPVPVTGPDEAAQLGHTLDAMRGRLRESLEHEREANAHLERRVEVRTEQLARSEAELRKRNAELSVLNEEIHHKEVELAELLRRIMAAQEDERRRIARDMHDETCQTLAAVLVAIETAEVAPGTEAAKRQLAAARQLSERAIQDIHKLIFDLRPSLLDDLGLVAALRWYAETRLEAEGAKVYFELDGDERRLPPEIETAVFRIVQESIANVAKHARAENVVVRLEYEEASLVVEVEDDGQGFDLGDVRQPELTGSGFGLLGMRERAALIGGTIDLQSKPGQGTTVRFRLPLRASRAARLSLGPPPRGPAHDVPVGYASQARQPGTPIEHASRVPTE